MNKLLLSFLMLVFSTTLFAEKIKFNSDQEAVEYIKMSCIKYWQKPVIADQTSVTVNVYQQDNNLVIVEKSVYNRPAQYGRESFIETKDVTTTIDMKKVKVSRTFTNILLTETKQGAFTQTTSWSTKSIDNKTTTPVVYTLPLEYEKRETEIEIPRLGAAFRYLVLKYNPEEKKKLLK